MPTTVKLEQHGATSLLILNRPEARNAIDNTMMDELIAALGDFNRDPAQRALVLTGAGEQAFCGGMDLRMTRDLDATSALDWMRRTRALFEAVRALDKPSIVALNGAAAGAGYQIALLADIRIGHAKARMGQPEINVGLASILGARLMAWSLSHARTVELTLSGRLMEGTECHALGLFHELVAPDRVFARALAIAEELGAKPPTAMRLTKQALRETTQAAFDAAFETAARLQPEAYRSGEPQAAMARFLDRSKAD